MTATNTEWPPWKRTQKINESLSFFSIFAGKSSGGNSIVRVTKSCFLQRNASFEVGRGAWFEFFSFLNL